MDFYPNETIYFNVDGLCRAFDDFSNFTENLKASMTDDDDGIPSQSLIFEHLKSKSFTLIEKYHILVYYNQDELRIQMKNQPFSRISPVFGVHKGLLPVMKIIEDDLLGLSDCVKFFYLKTTFRKNYTNITEYFLSLDWPTQNRHHQFYIFNGCLNDEIALSIINREEDGTIPIEFLTQALQYKCVKTFVSLFSKYPRKECFDELDKFFTMLKDSCGKFGMDNLKLFEIYSFLKDQGYSLPIKATEKWKRDSIFWNIYPKNQTKITEQDLERFKGREAEVIRLLIPKLSSGKKMSDRGEV